MKFWPRYVISKLVQFRTGYSLAGEWFKERGIQRDEGTPAIAENSKLSIYYPEMSQEGRRMKKLNKVSLPILLNTKEGLQALAEFITTGRKHDTAKIEVRQIIQSKSRQLEATQATSQQAKSSKSGSD
ncbi:hypothetical protein TRICI_001935 [Trichomonascus ciferrii]|uniref:Uncharacterized protein n=1 Tax=Trichomonascus ciferrii TaxID=44093 RepID=A0A642V806_9ASCO|nr:hypothetical protein TRICI_001935 [Trichomonascus ciferrii]